MNSLRRKLQAEKDYLSLLREYEKYRRNANRGDEPFSRLLREGFAVIPNFFGDRQVEGFLAAIPPIEECQLSSEGTFTRFFSDAKGISGLRPFFESSLISETMERALGPAAVMQRSTVQYRTTIGHTGAFEHFYHIDSWRPRYKAFLYLTDVDETNGPFTYTPRTHYGWWRRRYDRDIMRVFQPGPDGYIHDEESAYVGCVWPHEHKALCAKLGVEPRIVTGGSGTLILFDARGLHKIQPLVRAPRIILSSYWIRRGQHT